MPAYEVQQARGTGLETAILVANKIALPQIDSGIAGGADSASDAPMVCERWAASHLLTANRANTRLGRIRALSGLRPGHLAPVCRWASTRPSQHRNCRSAVTPRTSSPKPAITTWLRRTTWFLRPPRHGLSGVAHDLNLRAGTTVEMLAELKAVFGKGEDATMTAGNSTPLTDGASAVLLASPQWAAERGLPALACSVDAKTATVDYVHGAEGMLMAPAYGAAPPHAKRPVLAGF